MSKYIDADELLKEASKDGAYGYVSAEQIADFPTADVIEVRHGRWLHLHLDPDNITGHTKGECSICGKLRIVDNFCPNCGASMRG